jgi:hypothetical protein
MNGNPNFPPSFASITTDPVANTTIIKVPMISAKNFLWVLDNLLGNVPQTLSNTGFLKRYNHELQLV